MRKEWIIVPLTLLLLAELQSCSPRIIEHEREVHDTTYVQQLQRDSLFFRDSIYIKEKGDTVYQYVEKWRTRYLERRDTVYQSVHDTTTIKETIEVPRKKGWWDKTKDYAIWALLALLMFAYRKQILKLLKTL